MTREEMQALLEENNRNLLQQMNIVVENVVTPKFNLLAENQQLMMEKLERLDDMEVLDTRITALEAMVKKLNRELNQLKRAQ